MGTRQRQRSMIRILTGVKVRHAPCGAILRQITASKGSKGERKADRLYRAYLWAHNTHMWALWVAGRTRFASGAYGRRGGMGASVRGARRAPRPARPDRGGARSRRWGGQRTPSEERRKEVHTSVTSGSLGAPGGRPLATADGRAAAGQRFVKPKQPKHTVTHSLDFRLVRANRA